MPERYPSEAERHRQDVLTFAAELIRTPSPSGQEGDLASCVLERMRELGYDEAYRDEAGNVVGVIKGTGEGRSILFCSHLDTGEPGDPELWEHPPLEAFERDGHLHGLGASDCKGALAAQIYAGALLKRLGAPAGDVLVAGVVMAERAEGFGIAHLFDKTLKARGLAPSLVVLGDPTGLDVCLGQRGRLELEVTTLGRTSHASAPWLGINAAYKMVSVIEGIHELAATLPSHPFLERSTIALTGLSCSPERFSLIPDRCTASLDRRYLPSESLDTVLMQVQSVLNRAAAKDPELKGEARIRYVRETAYTGLTKEVPKLLPPFVTSEAHPLVVETLAALRAQGATPNFDKWYFSTEGGYVASVVGVPTIGYGPGEEKYSHTPYDRVRIDALVAAVSGCMAIAAAVAGSPRERMTP